MAAKAMIVSPQSPAGERNITDSGARPDDEFVVSEFEGVGGGEVGAHHFPAV